MRHAGSAKRPADRHERRPPGHRVAAGTAAAPITFISAKSPAAPGDWKNIYFGYSPATGNRIENAVIEYAGGFSGAQGYGCGDAANDASVSS